MTDEGRADGLKLDPTIAVEGLVHAAAMRWRWWRTAETILHLATEVGKEGACAASIRAFSSPFRARFSVGPSGRWSLTVSVLKFE